MDPECPATMCPLIAPNGSPWTGEKNARCDTTDCPWWAMACSSGGPFAEPDDLLPVAGPNQPKRFTTTSSKTYDCPNARSCQWQIRATENGHALCPPREALRLGLDPRVTLF